MFHLLFPCLFVFRAVDCFCGENVRWSHFLNIDDAYGMWYGAGYAQHTPDFTNKPVEIGCITLYISDASADHRDDWLDWSVKRRNYNNMTWRSPKSNLWSGDGLSSSSLDPRLKRRTPNMVVERRRRDMYQERRRRDMYHERRIRVLWDEDGQTMEQTYVYSPEEPGLWTAEQWRPGESELRSSGVEWYPDDPPRHPEVIRVLKLTPDNMIMNHCTELGDGGVFSLILRREPTRAGRWEQLEWQKLLLSFGLTNPYRYMAVCAACAPLDSLVYLFLALAVLQSCN